MAHLITETVKLSEVLDIVETELKLGNQVQILPKENDRYQITVIGDDCKDQPTPQLAG